jgi:hypothetical protein
MSNSIRKRPALKTRVQASELVFTGQKSTVGEQHLYKQTVNKHILFLPRIFLFFLLLLPLTREALPHDARAAHPPPCRRRRPLASPASSRACSQATFDLADRRLLVLARLPDLQIEPNPSVIGPYESE